jgi:hypothetical protein
VHLPEDRRFALTGSTVVVGLRLKLQRHAHRQGRDSLGEEWFEELQDLVGRRAAARQSLVT